MAGEDPREILKEAPPEIFPELGIKFPSGILENKSYPH